VVAVKKNTDNIIWNLPDEEGQKKFEEEMKRLRRFLINPPMYYTREYGEVKEMEEFREKIKDRIDIKNYTDTLDTLWIHPIIAPKEEINKGLCQEDRYMSLINQMADISLQSDFEQFHNGDLIQKKRIIIDNVIRSLKMIRKKLGKKFDSDRMIVDIVALVKDEIGEPPYIIEYDHLA